MTRPGKRKGQARKIGDKLGKIGTDMYRHWQTGTARDRQGQQGTARDIHGQTETDMDRQGQTGTDRDRQGQEWTDRDRQGKTGRSRDRQGQIGTCLWKGQQPILILYEQKLILNIFHKDINIYLWIDYKTVHRCSFNTRLFLTYIQKELLYITLRQHYQIRVPNRTIRHSYQTELLDWIVKHTYWTELSDITETSINRKR